MTYCFIPGGPWISGSYWDDFLRTFPEKAVRLTLLNHESRYGKEPGRTYAEIKEDCRKQIKSLNENVILVGHSFGAWIATDLLDEPAVLKGALLGMPSSFQKLPEIEKELQAIPFTDFCSYWKKIQKFYYHQEINLSGETYWNGNENLNPSPEELERILNKLKMTQKPFHLIYGEHDIVQKLIPNIEIRNSGHFPMNEAPQQLRELLLTLR